MDEIIKFEDKKTAILIALNKLPPSAFPGDSSKGVSLIDGFFNMPLSLKLTPGTIDFGGPTIPAIAVVGNETGKIYYFAYKFLVKD